MENNVRVYTVGELTLREALPGAKYWSVRLPRVMLTRFRVEPQVTFQTHKHESEQITYVMEGTLEFDVEGEVFLVRAGEAIRLPSMVRHAVRALAERVEALDAWSSPSEEPWVPQDGNEGV